MILVQAMPLQTPDDVRSALQRAIEIEHATIPPYFTALCSITDGTNVEIAKILRDILIEEMEHMTLAANILNAVGGAPAFNDPSFIPTYPGGLPFHIGDRNGTVFSVGLAPFSKSLVRDAFMRIEEPDEPIQFPVKTFALAVGAPEVSFKTIGDFYRDLATKLSELGAGIITGDPRRQVAGALKGAFPVLSIDDALNAINTIVQQGEGTATEPLAGKDGGIAHYYRFAEIWNGKMLVKDTASPEGFSYSGELVPFDPVGILPIVTNPNTGTYKAAPMAARLSQQFDAEYTAVLNALHLAFNGLPSTIGNAVGSMFDCKMTAQRLMKTQIDGTTLNGAPVYSYMRTS